MRYPKIGAGDRVVFIYLTFTYLIPMFLNAILFGEITSSYKIFYPDLYQIIYLCLLVSFYFMLRPIVFSIDFKRVAPISGIFRAIGRVFFRARFIVGLLLIFVAIYSLMSGNNDYRYSNVGLSSRLSPFLFGVIILGLVVKLYFLWKIFIYRTPGKRSLTSRFSDVLFALFLLLTISGVSSTLFAIIVLVYSVSPKKLTNLIFKNDSNSRCLSGAVMLKLFGWLLVFILIILFGWFIGNIVKTGSFDGAVALTSVDGFISKFALYLVERTSSSYYAFAYSLRAEFAMNVPGTLELIANTWNSFLFRVDVLFGRMMDVKRPEINTMMRLNYLLLSENPINPREGTSAGLLGSFNYVFIAPFNVVFVSLYLLLFARMVNQLNFSRKYTDVTYIGAGLLLLFLLVFFESPFDIFLIIDELFIYYIFILSLVVANFKARYRPIKTADFSN